MTSYEGHSVKGKIHGDIIERMQCQENFPVISQATKTGKAGQAVHSDEHFLENISSLYTLEAGRAGGGVCQSCGPRFHITGYYLLILCCPHPGSTCGVLLWVWGRGGFPVSGLPGPRDSGAPDLQWYCNMTPCNLRTRLTDSSQESHTWKHVKINPASADIDILERWFQTSMHFIIIKIRSF